MDIFTSISPNRIPDQQGAVDSWIRLGLKVVAFNTEKEINVIKGYFPSITFQCARDTSEKIFGKPYVKISEILDFSKDDDIICISNSDIAFEDNKEKLDLILEKAKTGLVYIRRFNINKDNHSSAVEIFGIDTFFFNSKIRLLYPRNNLSIGQCIWDYWIPYCAMKNNIKIYCVNQPFAFHKTHPLNWNASQAEQAAQIFIEETGWKGEKGALGHELNNIIIANSEMIQLPLKISPKIPVGKKKPFVIGRAY